MASSQHMKIHFVDRENSLLTSIIYSLRDKSITMNQLKEDVVRHLHEQKDSPFVKKHLPNQDMSRFCHNFKKNVYTNDDIIINTISNMLKVNIKVLHNDSTREFPIKEPEIENKPVDSIFIFKYATYNGWGYYPVSNIKTSDT